MISVTYLSKFSSNLKHSDISANLHGLYPLIYFFDLFVFFTIGTFSLGHK